MSILNLTSCWLTIMVACQSFWDDSLLLMVSTIYYHTQARDDLWGLLYNSIEVPSPALVAFVTTSLLGVCHSSTVTALPLLSCSSLLVLPHVGSLLSNFRSRSLSLELFSPVARYFIRSAVASSALHISMAPSRVRAS